MSERREISFSLAATSLGQSKDGRWHAPAERRRLVERVAEAARIDHQLFRHAAADDAGAADAELLGDGDARAVAGGDARGAHAPGAGPDDEEIEFGFGHSAALLLSRSEKGSAIARKAIVEPVQRLAVDQRTVHHLAMIAGPLDRRESPQIFRATQRIEQHRRARRERIVLGLRQQGRAGDQLRPAFQRELLGRSQIVAQVIDAMNPIAALNNAPTQLAIGRDHRLEAIQNARIEFSEV